MKNQLFSVLFFFAITLLWCGCSNDSGGDDDGSGDDLAGGFGSGGVGMDATGDEGGDDATSGGLGSSSGGGTSGGGGGDFVACETLSTDLERMATRVMLLEDKSYSMAENNKWALSLGAINEMVSNYQTDIAFGLDLFSRATSNDGEMCAVGSSVVHDVALNNGATINQELGGWQPSAATPLLLAMLNYTDASYAPIFLDGTGGSYLVIISDGMDTCSSDGVFRQDQGASAEELAAVTTNLRNLFGIRTIVIGFGEGVDPAQLNAIAQAGGTRFTSYLQAGNGDELTSALSQIAETVVVSCQFQVGTFSNPDIDFGRVVVTMDGAQVRRDDGCKSGEGWTWTSNAHTAIEFCANTCQQIESGNVGGIKVELACSDDDILIYE